MSPANFRGGTGSSVRTDRYCFVEVVKQPADTRNKGNRSAVVYSSPCGEAGRQRSQPLKDRLRAQYLPKCAACSYVRITVDGHLAGNDFSCRWTYINRSVCWVTQEAWWWWWWRGNGGGSGIGGGGGVLMVVVVVEVVVDKIRLECITASVASASMVLQCR